MPTARPSIAASVVTVEVRSVRPLASWMPSAPMPTPISAVSSGRPAAGSDPKVIVSTKTATITPSASDRRLGLDGGGRPAVLDLEPAVRDGAGRGLDGVGLRRGHIGLRDREPQVRIRDAPVLGHRAGLERIGG